ncbi:hypothetical protein HPB52_000844 [Rhipicephalus sanguineus]|uniref:Tick transposon n=1 Tax=Rhipicephalus sanguineus TaxID=34632 RepID=A0A9D4PDT3_RHISA|nr:hypothetical protein HPB52_000844 [Rhipicephalus sanguineus]
MTALARELDHNSDIGSAIYADDITIWSRGGSVGHTETTLQEAVHTVEKHLSRMKLVLSDSKSELLVYQPIRMGRRPQGWVPTAEIDIHLVTKNGAVIPRKDTIRVLGMLISENGRNAATIHNFVAAVVDMSGRTVSAASVRTRSIGVAEQVAISLALTTKDPCPVFSDSMTAVREPVKRSGTFGSRPLRGRCPPRVFRNPRPRTQ